MHDMMSYLSYLSRKDHYQYQYISTQYTATALLESQPAIAVGVGVCVCPESQCTRDRCRLQEIRLRNTSGLT